MFIIISLSLGFMLMRTAIKKKLLETIRATRPEEREALMEKWRTELNMKNPEEGWVDGKGRVVTIGLEG